MGEEDIMVTLSVDLYSGRENKWKTNVYKKINKMIINCEKVYKEWSTLTEEKKNAIREVLPERRIELSLKGLWVRQQIEGGRTLQTERRL